MSGAVEGPFIVDAAARKVPPPRLASLGSGRDDGFFVKCDLRRMERALAALVAACASGTMPNCPLLETLGASTVERRA